MGGGKGPPFSLSRQVLTRGYAMGRGGRLVVIGGVAAGLSAAARAKRVDSSLDITVIEQGTGISHASCGLPFLIAGEIGDAESLVSYSPQRFESERGVRVLTNHRAVEISHAGRQVVVHDLRAGERKRVEYDRLVLATGAVPRLPFEVQQDTKGVFVVRNLDDAVALKMWLEKQRPCEAAVIGAGVQGLEWADALQKRGLKVTLIERRGFVATRCDPEIGALVRSALQDADVRVKTGATVLGVETDSGGSISTVSTDSGAVPCGVAIVSCGVEPRADLAREAGIILDRCGAIAVDETMETNIRGIYAAGDCACTNHLVTGAPYYQPTGALAVKTGRIAGSNAAGRHAAFSGGLATQAVVASDYELGITGLNSEEAERCRLRPVAVNVRARERAGYIAGAENLTVRLIADAESKRLIGAQLFGKQGVTGRLGVLTAAIASRMPLDELASLDLPYAPKASPVWDPLHIAAGELLKLL